ncbi:hypothetical protein [Streptomyces sp. NBC_00448]|uniref:hypothetical protein n=1 Tax=Streptomyces sp. NBC_00448 TaxID=2903652 RepID=UPI002E223499
MSASPLALPPVRLLPADVLARQALAAPLLDRALRLTRWAGEQRRVDGMGELLDDELTSAVKALGLTGDEGPLDALQAWGVAVDTGLLVLEIEEEAEESTPPGEAAGQAVPGEVYARIGQGGAADGADPYDVLDLWLGAVECALAETTAPDYDNLLGDPDGDGEAISPEEADREAEEEAELLDAALVNLYALSALEVADAETGGASAEPAGADGDGARDGRAVPLPVLAASLVLPDEMEQPSEAVLEEVTAVMLRLDEHFRLLEATGLVAYTPMDEALIEEADDEGVAALGEPDDDEIARYGAVRLTPLGVYGVRERLADAGAYAPVLGDLAEAGADELLGALGSYPDHAVRIEAEAWLARREPAAAAAELLAAAKGDGADGPTRRLVCQQVLAVLGAEAEPAVRDVLDDPHLGGLARVWLTERHAPDVPAPTTDMVYWLTIDTVAAQLAADGDSDELAALITELIARHEEFFADAWRVEHPATAAVLEAIGRLHPDRPTAKASRKAAFKARSRSRS